MKSVANFGRLAAWTATAAMIVSPGLAGAAEPAALGPPLAATSPAYCVADVALDVDGSLRGQAVTLQGQPIAGAQVLLDDGVEQVAATTDAGGQFQFDAVRGGAYRLQVGAQTQFCRAWKYGTAPPAATRGVMVVQGDQAILGQNCGGAVGCGSPVRAGLGGCGKLLSNPLVVGGVIAAAIAIPVALANSDDDDAIDAIDAS
jgi:hypothetical protein